MSNNKTVSELIDSVKTYAQGKSYGEHDMWLKMSSVCSGACIIKEGDCTYETCPIAKEGK